MTLNILIKPTISSAIAFGFVVLAFFFGYGLNNQHKPQTDQEKFLYTTLLGVISWSVISAVINASVEVQADDKANKTAKEEAKQRISNYANKFSKELDNIEIQLKGLNIRGDVLTDCLRRINEIKTNYNGWMEQYNAAKEVLKWLNVEKNRRYLAKSVVENVLPKQNLTKKQRDAFYWDIRSCLNWLQKSFEDDLKSAEWIKEKHTSAMNEDIQDGLELYKQALDLIKQKDKLKELDNGTGVVEEFIDILKNLYDSGLNQ
ncbi:hypothetical protein LC653_16370 [Nostoc sp. CHAB 5784]|uniref:hypothetical protein n=1 Tax=Nostoc mirabile TaxID=2907820 RepID=UPI001E3C21E6|nr:hypothetical protein [Nostoc mirabile]MCC5665451.1 hypothetical protein [Nostoc mirabile CHAB5784]